MTPHCSARPREWSARAGEALAQRDREAAIDFYRSAIPAARLYLTRPGADGGGKAEIAELFRQLGTLQALHASTAEARASYREGRRILLTVRGGRGGTWNEGLRPPLRRVRERPA